MIPNRRWTGRAAHVKILRMTGQLPLPLYMTRHDPARNMARFYVISLVPTLFGEVSVLRNWGRIGSRGQMMVDTFQTAEDAIAASDRLGKIKRRRGYRPPCPDAQPPAATT